MELGKDVFIIYDDFFKYVVVYRVMFFLFRCLFGREVYFGDVFYLYLRFLERVVKLNV